MSCGGGTLPATAISNEIFTSQTGIPPIVIAANGDAAAKS